MPATKGVKAPKNEKSGRNALKKRDDAAKETVAENSTDSSGDESDCCIDCGRAVLDSQKGLACDSCGFWHHTSCEKISDEVYAFLNNNRKETSILWYCKKCLKTYKKMSQALMAIHDHHQQLEDRVDKLASSMNQKMEEITAMMISKFDSQDTPVGVEVQSTQKRVEDKMDMLMETMEKQRKTEGHLVYDAVQDAVTARFHEDRQEAEEIRKRKTSVIIYGLKESTDVDPELRKRTDQNEIEQILHEIRCDQVSVNAAVRLGRQDADGKPRPLKVVMASEEQQQTVLNQAKNLRKSKGRGYERVFINQDMTPRQQKQRAVLVKELKQRQSNGEKDLILIDGKIVQRRTRETSDTAKETASRVESPPDAPEATKSKH